MTDESDSQESIGHSFDERFKAKFPPPNPRKQPYPQAENRREYTSREPPAPKQAPQPKPRPKARKPASPTPTRLPAPPTTFERLMAMSLQSVIQEIVGELPGPKVEWASFKKEYPKLRDQRMQLLLVCVFEFSAVK